MEPKEWSKLWYNPQINIELYQASCIKRGFPPHMHEYYVICLIEQGFQSFSHRKVKHLTPPGGLIILNPGDDHTGEPADEEGFIFRAIYPTEMHMQEALVELTGKRQDAPFFPRVRVDDPELSGYVWTLHQALIHETDPMERESLFMMVLTKLILEHADSGSTASIPRKERQAVRQACRYIDDHLSQGITLTELANAVGFSRYYFLRVFREAMGVPTHTYLESLRISKAKRLLEEGISITQVAGDLGFSDQSHFSNRFKRFIGITPGQYVLEVSK